MQVRGSEVGDRHTCVYVYMYTRLCIIYLRQDFTVYPWLALTLKRSFAPILVDAAFSKSSQASPRAQDHSPGS